MAAQITAPMPTACGARQPLSPAEIAAREFEQSARKGHEVSAGLQRVLKEITWHRQLADAQKVARAQNKPIVWVQALGDLRGLT
jgi:hypothetical protein